MWSCSVRYFLTEVNLKQQVWWVSLASSKELLETGLSITGCRHGIAQRAVNMFYGEVYGYAHYIQIRDMIPRKVSFFWEDVACKYWPWLAKKDATTASLMKPALSVMHGKAHSWPCQVNCINFKHCCCHLLLNAIGWPDTLRYKVKSN